MYCSSLTIFLTSGSVASMEIPLISRRWVMISDTSLLSNSKMLLIISFSVSRIVPFSSPTSTIIRISSSVTSLGCAFGSKPNNRRIPLVVKLKRLTKGKAMIAMNCNMPTTLNAIASALFIAMRFGTNSPKTKVKNDKAKVINTTEIVLTISGSMGT